jgi:hypothetical protein
MTGKQRQKFGTQVGAEVVRGIARRKGGRYRP